MQILLYAISILLLTVSSAQASDQTPSPAAVQSLYQQFLEQEVPERPLREALDYFERHPRIIKNKNYITIIDFRQPSTQKRMYLLNMQTGAVERYLVAHGVNTGVKWATDFSNVNGSRKSSLGFILTGELYRGKYGLSMRMDGLESRNSNVRRRAIVMHGADYVSQSFIDRRGYLGRSWGCPALEMRHIKPVIRRIHGKSLMLKYR